MKTIRWGIIGCGNVTEVKSGPGFQKADRSELRAVMRRSGELAKDYAARHNVPKWTDRAEAVIHDPEIDAVYIATPPAYHKEYTLACARAGKPVYVEKPMARTHDECLEMIEACSSAGVPLFVAFYRRAQPRFQKIRALLEEQAIGEVRFVSIVHYEPPNELDLVPEALPWRVNPEIAGGGRFVDVASHTLDILDYLFGPIARAAGTAVNQAGLYPAEDLVTGTFSFACGVQGAGIWCFTSFARHEMNEIVGSRGKISFSTFGGEPIVLTTASGSASFSIPPPQHVQQPLIQTIVDELNGCGICPSTGVTAARTSWVMDQMLRGYRGS